MCTPTGLFDVVSNRDTCTCNEQIILFIMFFITHTILLLDVSEMCSKVLPEEMKDMGWNVVRTGNPVYLNIADGLMAVGVSHELREKTASEFVFDIWM